MRPAVCVCVYLCRASFVSLHKIYTEVYVRAVVQTNLLIIAVG